MSESNEKTSRRGSAVPRKVFAVLTSGLAVLSVASAVVLAFHALLASVGDAAAARLLLGVGRTCLALLAIDLVLLVGALGFDAMQKDDRTS